MTGAEVLGSGPVVLAQADPGAVRVFGVTLVGVSTTTGVKLLFTLALVAVVLLARSAVLAVLRRLLGGEVADPRRFWARQGVQRAAAPVLVLGVVSIWVTPDTDLTTGVGLLSAGLAFALQQVIVSFAAYVVILRGDTFGVGDRITLGGVRGDVVRLGFLKTTIMEMGQPPAVADTDPAVWVHSRQYTGRPVTVTNGVIFTDPVYNYTREFPTCGRRSSCRSTGWSCRCGSSSPPAASARSRTGSAATSWTGSTPPASASPPRPTTSSDSPR